MENPKVGEPDIRYAWYWIFADIQYADINFGPIVDADLDLFFPFVWKQHQVSHEQ